MQACSSSWQLQLQLARAPLLVGLEQPGTWSGTRTRPHARRARQRSHGVGAAPRYKGRGKGPGRKGARARALQAAAAGGMLVLSTKMGEAQLAPPCVLVARRAALCF